MAAVGPLRLPIVNADGDDNDFILSWLLHVHDHHHQHYILLHVDYMLLHVHNSYMLLLYSIVI